jgi:hypothetical protein
MTPPFVFCYCVEPCVLSWEHVVAPKLDNCLRHVWKGFIGMFGSVVCDIVKQRHVDGA